MGRVRHTTDKPRLVYLHQYFRGPGQPGGMRSWEIARRLSEHYDVHMVTTASDADSLHSTWRVRDVGPLTVHEYALEDPHHRSNDERMSAFLRFAVVAAKRAWSIDPDVVFATSTPLTIAIPAIATRFARRAPLVFEVRDLWPDAPIAVGALDKPVIVGAARLLERVSYRVAHAVIALSPPQAEAVSERGARRVSTVPNFANPALFDASVSGLIGDDVLPPQIENRSLVLYPGTMGLVNGAGWLVEVAAAAARLAEGPECEQPVFAIVGSGREEVAIRHRAEELGVLDKNFFLLGEWPKGDIPRLLRRADMVCDLIIDRPDLWKASPNKVFDAFAAGKPLLINHGGWIADLLERTGAGVVVGQHDHDGAARSILDFLSSPEAIADAAGASAALADRYDVDQGVDAILERIDAACGRVPT